MPTTLITGATDGIGLELAKLYRAQGHRLVMIGRKPLAAISDHPSTLYHADNYIQADLAQPDCAEKVLAGLAKIGLSQLDLVIHNAGVGWVGPLAEQSNASIADVVTVNTIAPITLTHALLPFVTAVTGKLVFVSSVVSAIPGPNFSSYAASKAALDGFARSLRVELRGQASVQVIHPGATKTGMHKKVGMQEKQYKRFVSAEKVAKKIVKAIGTNKRAVTIGTTNKLVRKVGPLLNRNAKPTANRNSSAPLHAVITGAADGIGKALAARYAQAGYRVTGIDFDAERSAATSAELQANGADIRFITADLTQELDWIDRLPAADVFIHNAGISAAGHFASLPSAQQTAVLTLNLTAPLQITARLVEKQLLNNGATVVFISSLSKYVSYPGAAAYAASKDGLAHAARSVAAAYHPNIRSMTVFPGPVRTAHARRYSPDNSREHTRMSPAALAEHIFNDQQAGKRICLPGAAPKVFATLGILTPRLMEFAMRKTILDKFPATE